MKDIGYHLCGRRGDRKGQFINLFVSHKLALGGKIGKLAASWGRKLEEEKKVRKSGDLFFIPYSLVLSGVCIFYSQEVFKSEHVNKVLGFGNTPA